MGQTPGIVEKLILQGPPLQALQQDALESGFRMDNTALALLQPAGTRPALQRAHPAADADVGIDTGTSFGLAPLPLRCRLYHAYCLDRTGPGALPTADTGGFIDRGDEVGRHHAMGIAELTDAEQGIATALATVADKGDVLLHVVGVEHQSRVPGTGKMLAHLFPGDLFGQIVADEIIGTVTEGGAAFEGHIAFFFGGMELFVAATADTDGEFVRRFDKGGGPLVIEDLQILPLP